MLVFEGKKELMEFLHFVVDNFDKKLTDSGFEVNLSVTPIDKSNLRSVVDTYQAYQKSKESLIQKV